MGAFKNIEKTLVFSVFPANGAIRESLGVSLGDFVEILSTPGGTQGVPGGYLGALGATLGGTRGVRAISGGALGSQRGVAGGVSGGFSVSDASPRAVDAEGRRNRRRPAEG